MKPHWWEYKFTLSLLHFWRAAKSLICCPHIVVFIINEVFDFHLKHDTPGISKTFMEHNDISHFTITHVMVLLMLWISLTVI